MWKNSINQRERESKGQDKNEQRRESMIEKNRESGR